MTEKEPLGPRLVLTDAALLAALSLAAMSPLADAFDGLRWVVAAFGGIVIGLAGTLLARRLRWGAVLTALLLAVAYCLVGPALAAPDRALGGIIPTARAERDLLTGTVDGWRNALTLPVPLTDSFQVLVVPLVVGLLGATLAATFLWRSRWPSVAGLGVVAMFAVAATFGTRGTELPVVRGLALTIVLLVWIRWRALRSVRTSWPRRILLTTSVVAVAAIAGWGVNAATAGDATREVLRDHVDPPLEQLDFKSPLSKYRSYYLTQDDKDLFRIDGLPDGARVRLATMDEFDGIVWNVSTLDRSSGSSAFDRAAPAQSSTTVTITIDDYAGPWVPTIGGASGVSLTSNGDPDAARQLLRNDSTGAIAQIGGVAAGDVYTVDWSPTPAAGSAPSDAAADRSVAFDRPARQLPQLDKLAQTWIAQAGASSDAEIAAAVAQGFSTKGFYSDGRRDEAFATASGHGAKRLADLVADPSRMIGNDEQYASAMAFELQSLGMPARVVLGLEADKGPDFVGGDIAAWVEVRFVGTGWVAFDPTPPEDQQPAVLQEDPNPVPQPNVVQPPILPKEPATAEGAAPEGAGKSLSGQAWELLLKILGYVIVAGKILLLLSPLWALALIKRIRRLRRRRDPDLLVRMSGGWREVADRARDLGTTLPRSQTRVESSMVLAGRYPRADLPPLATVADRHVFGPVDPSADEVDAYWADVRTALKRMRKDAPWWRRPLAWLSPASIPWRSVGRSSVARARTAGIRVASSRLGRRVAGAGATARSAVTSAARRKGRR
ncbi:transglutaminase family protein [Aeromicrobium fastidiosum]|uniref:Transglutaminase domain-containing protein n=1 Tax=Aeromicrobium fastidiosum TaxID=52699 RepID=A0A641AIH8_9ACTN|nr:transglutaminase domain-containing protein [Aeromicrobium fastidiosum]KAA1374683.1 transglutaminase domain-containing protein [Aeromicrobium fastidiosum]MBP2390770.1 hypothetical protein [Aeromicrobium fastidiosum]